jgi:ribosomal protein L11 methylase PrmA
LNETGVLIGSGVLETDESKIREKATAAGFAFELQMIRDNWMSFSLKNH